MKKSWFSKKIIGYEVMGLIFVIVIVWSNEFLDIPHYLFGAEQTPINWQEGLFETIAISAGWIVIIFVTHRLLKRIQYLEGFLSICASCKKIKDTDGRWTEVESYIKKHSAAEFSHSICPECAKRLYPELL
ncbi:MAG: hypothetical protein JXA04_05365 [Gammaproteobacteria bacterium]|nr:hypothetical protein [Gammaproteobacteria bacterium]